MLTTTSSLPDGVYARLVDDVQDATQRLQDPEFVAALAAREPAYQVARLRILRGLAQKQLAELVGAKQSSIARLERGATPPNLFFLSKVAATDHRLWLQFSILFLTQYQSVILYPGEAQTSEDTGTDIC